MDAIRVLLVDDNDDFLNGASEWLVTDAEIELVGTATTGKEALGQVERLTPDVVVIDESQPDMRIVDVIRRLRSSRIAPRIVLLTFHDGETARQVKAATRADEVVAKSRVTDRLLPVIRNLLRTRPRHAVPGPRPTEITRSEP